MIQLFSGVGWWVQARAIGVSNFNAFDLQELHAWAGRTQPIEVNEAHFTVAEIDTEALARRHWCNQLRDASRGRG